jgi:hypothetical protein
MNVEPVPRLGTLPVAFPATVAALHRVAEQVIAPARKPDNEIALQATPGGFGTPAFEWEGSVQQVRVEGAELVFERRQPLDVDPDAAGRLADWYAFGAAILGELGGEPTLWPEHFDIAIELDEVNYGFSPGDEHHTEPYAYVGPWTAPPAGPLWNATGFPGAELTYAELLAAPDQRAAALEFFMTRKEALA